MSDTPADAEMIVAVKRHWLDGKTEDGYHYWPHRSASDDIRWLLARLERLAAPVSGDENGREDAAKLCTRPDMSRSTNSLPERDSPVSGDARGILTTDDIVRLEQIDEDIETEGMTEYCAADLIWMRGLLQQALDALTAAEAEGKRAALGEAMRRMMRIYINEAPDGMSRMHAANWAMGIARDEIRALADTPGELA